MMNSVLANSVAGDGRYVVIGEPDEQANGSNGPDEQAVLSVLQRQTKCAVMRSSSPESDKSKRVSTYDVATLQFNP